MKRIRSHDCYEICRRARECHGTRALDMQRSGSVIAQ
jgi:hypothetical protein